VKTVKQTVLWRLVFLLAVVFSCWAIYDACAATTKNVTIVWDYDNPPTDLLGFDLRVNGDNSTLIDIQENVREWSGVIVFQDGNNTLDIRAKDETGQVSPWSEPCYYDPVPSVPTGVRVTVEVTVVVN